MRLPTALKIQKGNSSVVLITNSKDRSSTYYSSDEKEVFMTPDSPWQGSTFEERWRKLREDRRERKKSLKKMHAHQESSDTTISNDSSVLTIEQESLSTPRTVNSGNHRDSKVSIVETASGGGSLPLTPVGLDSGFSDVLELYASKEAQFFMREQPIPIISSMSTNSNDDHDSQDPSPKLSHSALLGPTPVGPKSKPTLAPINIQKANDLRPSMSQMSLAEVAERRRDSNSELYPKGSAKEAQETREQNHNNKLEKLQTELDEIQERMVKIKNDIKTLSVVLDNPTEYYMLGKNERNTMKDKREQLRQELKLFEKKKYEVGILFSKAWKRRRESGLSDFWVRNR
jgi:hypothetical protein